ncbi:hypothetical protein [Streptomyces sp. NPDC002580]|uniref:hypothetical protein n=1 Tax=Streptomyces sp. NPDC002580 TaxID=3364653 RepID=UPI0036AB2B18
MTAPTYRLRGEDQVIELGDVVSDRDEPAIEEELIRLMPHRSARSVVLVLRAPTVTAATLRLLLHLRRAADAHGVVLRVVVPDPRAARLLELAGLRDQVRLGTPPPEAAAADRDPGRPVPPRAARRRLRAISRSNAQIRSHLYALVRAQLPHP